MHFTTEQIIALAPDAASAKSARTLATVTKWQNLAHDEQALWGECQGSGAKPYQTCIQLDEPAFKCTCPSRKIPCKHSLGLFLLFASSPSVFNETSAPDWVSEWLSKRQDQKERKEARAAKSEHAEVDEATLARRESQKAKRAIDREAKVAAGLKELELWLRDLVRAGLATAQTRPISYWDQIAARMVDAQAPGVARRLRELPNVIQSSVDWTERLLQQIGSIFLLVKAHQRLETLTAATQADVRTAIGWTQKEDELPNDNLIRDDWMVLGQRVSGEESLRVQRTWLWAKRTQRGALILDFAVAGQPFSTNLISGTSIDAELLFYPGNYPLRAIVRNSYATSHLVQGESFYANSNQLMMAYADGLSRNAWLETIPAPLDAIVPFRQGDRWFARDLDQRLLPIASQSNEGWQLAALSGGHPIQIICEWNGRSLLPLAVRAEGRYVEL